MSERFKVEIQEGMEKTQESVLTNEYSSKQI